MESPWWMALEGALSTCWMIHWRSGSVSHVGLGGAIGKEEEEGDAEEDGGQAFDEEEPLPAVRGRGGRCRLSSAPATSSHEDGAERKGDVEAADGAGAEFGWEPLHEVEDDAGEEAGFGHAEEEASGVELERRSDEHHAHGEQAPGDHDAGEPAARSEAVEQQVGGDLAGGVAEEEEAGAEAVDGGAEVQVAVHLECGEADVDAVHVGDAVAERDEGDETPGGFAGCRAADGVLCDRVGWDGRRWCGHWRNLIERMIATSFRRGTKGNISLAGLGEPEERVLFYRREIG